MENKIEITKEDKLKFEQLQKMFSPKDKVKLSHNNDEPFDEEEYERNANDSLEFFSNEWKKLLK
jgi:hypothetical protein